MKFPGQRSECKKREPHRIFGAPRTGRGGGHRSLVAATKPASTGSSLEWLCGHGRAPLAHKSSQASLPSVVVLVTLFVPKVSRIVLVLVRRTGDTDCISHHSTGEHGGTVKSCGSSCALRARAKLEGVVRAIVRWGRRSRRRLKRFQPLAQFPGPQLEP